MPHDSQYSDAPRRDSRFVLGMLAGAAAGGALALLFAPREGSQMRNDLASGAQRAGRRLNEAYSNVAGSVRQGARRLAGEAEDLRDRVEDTADSLHETFDDAASRLQDATLGSGTQRQGTYATRTPPS